MLATMPSGRTATGCETSSETVTLNRPGNSGGADTKAVAATVLSLMHGLIVMHHLVDDVSADALLRGVSSLGAAPDSSSLHRVREVESSPASI